MYKKLFMLLILMILLSGCSSTYFVGEDPQNYIKRINYLGSIYSSTIELTDRTQFYADSLLIENDTLFIKGDELKSVSIENVSSIKLRDVARGFFDGLWSGLGISLVSLGILARGSGDMAGAGYGILIIGGTVIGASIIIHTLSSGNKTFLFKRNPDNSFTQIE